MSEELTGWCVRLADGRFEVFPTAEDAEQAWYWAFDIFGGAHPAPWRAGHEASGARAFRCRVVPVEVGE